MRQANTTVEFEIRKNAISVKNAVLATTKDYDYIIHYDTIIFKQDRRTKEILVLLPVSLSSQNAIQEGIAYLTGENYAYIDNQLVEKLNGLTKSELVKVWKHKRYNQPERRKKAQIEQIVNDLLEGEQ